MIKNLLLVTLILLGTSCTSQQATNSPTPGSNSSSSPSSSPATGSSTSTTQSGNVSLERTVLIKGLDTPWALDFAKDGRMFVTERKGNIRIIKDNILQAEPWITLSVQASGEGGLLGLALDPDFSNNGYAYVAYTYKGSDGNVYNKLVRLHEDKNTGKATEDKVLIDAVPGGTNHDGGRVKFGPDGKLYWSMGEKFERQLAQDTNNLNGKIMRLNSDGSIPSDNPIKNSYIYSYGHRNVQGLAWNPENKAFYSTEHGPSGENGCCHDEVNYTQIGKNYGWPLITGDQTKDGLITPIANSENDVWAPSGASFVTQGAWKGSLLFAGLRGQALYRVVFENNSVDKVSKVEENFKGEYGRLRDVVEGPDGNFYILTNNRDGRGSPGQDDDRLIMLKVTAK